MRSSKTQGNKILLSGSIDPDVYDALQSHCRSHPQLSRSQVMTRALRQYLLPDYQEERQRVLAETLDRLWWHQHNQADRLDRELRTIREMLALLVRTFYNHMPEVPESQRQAAVLSGEQRFGRFLEVLAEHVGTGKSAIQRMPEPVAAEPDIVVMPNDSPQDLDQPADPFEKEMADADDD